MRMPANKTATRMSEDGRKTCRMLAPKTRRKLGENACDIADETLRKRNKNGKMRTAIVRLPDSKRKTLGEKGIDCIFVGYADHSKAYRFYVIEPNDSISINSIIESRDVIFDENRFSSIPRPKDIIPNLYLVEGSRDQVGSQYSYCFSIEEDPKTYNEAMQSRDASFWKEAIDDEIGSIMENNTWVLSDLPPGCKPLGCKWIFKRKMKVDGTIDKFKARLVIQGFRQKEGIDYFDTYAPVARITTIRLLLALAAIHNLVIYQMDIKTAFLNRDLDEEVYMKQLEGFVMPGNEHKVCKLVKSLYGLKQAPKHTRPDIAYAIGRLSRFTSNPSRQHWKAMTRVFKYLRGSSSMSGWVFLLGGGVISWASKKQKCITSSTMESEVVALAAAGKEAEWLRNLIHDIPIWPKPITPISIRCDSVLTMAKAYSQVYIGKSRYLGVRHSMIRKLITKG
ncbi:zinc finger, CCHC-type containing protein [Tanacetum coccineum]